MILGSDIVYFKECQCSLVNTTPVVNNDFDINVITLGKFFQKQFMLKEKIINLDWFLDDINALNSGLPLPRYDAFLLYDNADIQSASAVVEKLEIDYKLKVSINFV